VIALKDKRTLRKETGSLKDNPPKRTAYKIDRDKLSKHYKENPHATDKETAVI